MDKAIDTPTPNEMAMVVGVVTECINRLNSVTPDTSFEDVRRMCRLAAQLLKTLNDTITELENET